jgi:uncharacterized membrane protein
VLSRGSATGRSTIWSRLALVLLLVILALNIYRAVTQSLTTDEAFTYHNFVSKPFGGLVEPFEANNHVLNSLLSRLTVAVFGSSEWAIRMPSVLAGAVYLWVSYRLCFFLFGGGMWSLVTLALLTTDPFLLDYLSAARGYGMGLALLLIAAFNLLRATDASTSGRLYTAGICSGLSIAAVMVFVFPVSALAAAFIVLTSAQGRFHPKAFWDCFVVPAILVAFLLVILPLSKSAPDKFYFGVESLEHCVRSLSEFSFSYGPIPWARFSALNQYSSWLANQVWPFVSVLLAASVLGAWWQLYLLRSGDRKRQSRADSRTCFFECTFVLAVILVVAAHVVAGVPYPLTRTALYFIPLSILSASALCYRYRHFKLVTGVALLIATACVAAFVLQVNVSSYVEWRFDSGTKRIASFLKLHSPPSKHLVIRASWVLEPSLNFYRTRYGLNCDPINRKPLDNNGDVFILTKEDHEWMSKLHLRAIYQDEVSGTVVAVPNLVSDSK